MGNAIFRDEWDEQKITLAADRQSGDILQLPDGQVGVLTALNSEQLVTGAHASAKTSGIYDVATASGTTFSAGASVHWDDTAKLAITAAGDFIIGKCVETKGAGPTTVKVQLNGQGPTV